MSDGVDKLRRAGTSWAAPTKSSRWCSSAGSSHTARTIALWFRWLIHVWVCSSSWHRHHVVPGIVNTWLKVSVSYKSHTEVTRFPGLPLLGGTTRQALWLCKPHSTLGVSSGGGVAGSSWHLRLPEGSDCCCCHPASLAQTSPGQCTTSNSNTDPTWNDLLLHGLVTLHNIMRGGNARENRLLGIGWLMSSTLK